MQMRKPKNTKQNGGGVIFERRIGTAGPKLKINKPTRTSVHNVD